MKDKIPFFEIVNKFFIGAVFSILFVLLTAERIALLYVYNEYASILKDWSVLAVSVLVITMYEIGFIINRASSAFIAPVLEKTKIWPKGKYDVDISEIKEKNKSFEAMITENIVTRSHILMFLLLSVVALVCSKWWFAVAFILCIISLVFAGRKHSKRINQIRNAEAARKEK